MKYALINLACLCDRLEGYESQFDAQPSETMKLIIDALSEHFEVIAYSPWFQDKNRQQIHDWLIEGEFNIDEVLLKADHTYGDFPSTILDLIDERFGDKAEAAVVFVVENNANLVNALLERDFYVMEPCG